MNKQTDMTPFSARLFRTAETFGAQFSQGLAESYFEALADLTLEEVADALFECEKHETFWPRPATVRKANQDSAVLAAMVLKAWGYKERRLTPKEIKAAKALFDAWKDGNDGQAAAAVLKLTELLNRALPESSR